MKEWEDKRARILVDISKYTVAELVFYRDLFSDSPQVREALEIEIFKRQRDPASGGLGSA